MYGSRGRRQDLGGLVVSLPVLAENWQNWQTGRTPSRFVSTPPRPIHQRKAPGETVTTVILHEGVLYYNLSYGGYIPKSQLAAKKPLFLSETMILYVYIIYLYIIVSSKKRGFMAANRGFGVYPP